MSFRAYDLLNLVNDFGETLTLRQVTTDGTYDPATGSVSGSATTDTNFTVKISRVVTIWSDGNPVCYLCDVEE